MEEPIKQIGTPKKEVKRVTVIIITDKYEDYYIGQEIVCDEDIAEWYELKEIGSIKK